MRAFSFSDTCDPRTPPLGLNLPDRDPRPKVRGSRFEVQSGRSRAQIPDERKRGGRESRGSGPIRPDPPRSDASWRKISERSRAVKSTGTTFERQLTAAAAAAGGRCRRDYDATQLQHDHETRTRIDNIPCYQCPKDRLTRPRVPRISGQSARFKPKSTAIRRPRTPCRPAGAWAMFLTNSCHKNDMGYNYVIRL